MQRHVFTKLPLTIRKDNNDFCQSGSKLNDIKHSIYILATTNKEYDKDIR